MFLASTTARFLSLPYGAKALDLRSHDACGQYEGVVRDLERTFGRLSESMTDDITIAFTFSTRGSRGTVEEQSMKALADFLLLAKSYGMRRKLCHFPHSSCSE